MQKAQLRFQKVVIAGSMALAALMIVYALGFSTNLYSLSYHVDSSSSLFYVPGAEVYRAVQPFNRTLFLHTVALLAVCVTMFVTLTHRRRLYYVSNYVTSLAFGAYAVYIGRLLFVRATEFKAQYLSVDFEKLKSVTTMMKMKYVESTFMLDAGIVMSLLLMLWAVLLIVNLVLKTIWMRREKWLDAPEVPYETKPSADAV